MLFEATWTNLEITILSKVSQTVKDKQHMISLIRGISKKDENELICRPETDSQTLKTNLRLPKGKGDGSGIWEWHMHPIGCGMDGQWAPAIRHRKLYSIFCATLYGKGI